MVSWEEVRWAERGRDGAGRGGVGGAGQNKMVEQKEMRYNGGGVGREEARWGGRTKCADEKKLEATECSRSSLLIFFLSNITLHHVRTL